jgi:hypothetical protein
MSKREKVAYVLAEGIVCEDCITEEERARSTRKDTRIVERGPAGPVPDEVDICMRCKKII